MPVTPAPHLELLVPLLGTYRTSGVVRDEAGVVTATISGTDIYTLLPGGGWIAHDVDVTMGEERVLAHELIGGSHPDGGWQMHAFENADHPTLMWLTPEQPGLLLLRGDQIRSWLRPQEAQDHMTALWEREVEGTWLPWMDMRFDRR